MRQRLARWGARGVGFMIGIELESKDRAEAVQARCLADGMIVLICGPGENVLRLIPPLTATDEELDLGVGILERALTAH
jgi:diaminobutyrate-2-oxoglutarate transaminase